RGDLPERLATAIDTDPEQGRAWIDWTALIEAAQPFSGGERRLIAIAASLAGGQPVVLGDALSGLDDRNAELVAEMITHALDLEITGVAPNHARRHGSDVAAIFDTRKGDHQ
ncbi:MAG: ABC transporter ATP-binding protein, partial [Actinomycetota bacterium]